MPFARYRRWRENSRKRNNAEKHGFGHVKTLVCRKISPAAKKALLEFDAESTDASVHKKAAIAFDEIKRLHPEARKYTLFEWIQFLKQWEKFD